MTITRGYGLRAPAPAIWSSCRALLRVGEGSAWDKSCKGWSPGTAPAMSPVLPGRAGRAAASASCASTDGGVEAGRFCMGAWAHPTSRPQPHTQEVPVAVSGLTSSTASCRCQQQQVQDRRSNPVSISQDEKRDCEVPTVSSAGDSERAPGHSRQTGGSQRSPGTCMPGRPPTGEGALRGLDAGELASLRVRLRLTGCFALSGSSMRSRPSCMTRNTMSVRPASAAQRAH